MVAPGANGSFPLSTEDATKLTSIIPLNNPHTRTTGFQGTRMYIADLRGRRAAHDYEYYTAKNPDFSGTSCQSFFAQKMQARRTATPGKTSCTALTELSCRMPPRTSV